MNAIRSGALACAVIFLGSCGGSSGGGSAACPANSSFRKFVVNAVTLPLDATNFAADLNGDSKTENRYGSIVGALAQQNIDSQALMDQTISSGDEIVLIRQGSSDATFQNDACASASLQAGVPQASPNFTGSGTFTVDGAVPAVQFGGTLTASVFAAKDQSPSKTTGVSIKLPIGTALVPVTLVAAQVKYTVSAGGWLNGSVNGAILGSDLPAVFSGMATSFNDTITADPTSQTSQQLLTIFDTSAASGSCPSTCQNPDSSCAVTGDNVIDVCEVSTSTLIKNLLAPDVQLFDAGGNYSPNPSNTNRDSLSVGFGFTAVNASF